MFASAFRADDEFAFDSFCSRTGFCFCLCFCFCFSAHAFALARASAFFAL
jgi:hypothetical protein